MSKIILITVSLALILTCCKKEASYEPQLSEKTKLLTSKEWVVLKIEERESNGLWEDIFPQFLSCLKDNRFKFNVDFSVLYSEGPVACPPNNPNQLLDKENWKFNANETILLTGAVDNKILQLDAERLVVTSNETIAGVTYENKTTYGH